MILHIFLVPFGALLWYLGGYGYGEDGIPNEGIPRFGKGWRRWVWPTVIGVAAIAYHVTVPHAAVVAILIAISNALGYGESKSWAERVFVGFALGMPVILLYWSWVWPLATMLTFIPLYVFSLKHNWMYWGVVEAITGATQAACVLTALMLR